MAESDNDRIQDQEIAALAERVKDAASSGGALRIVGGDTKSFFGGELDGEVVSTTGMTGVISYDPTELVAHVRAGTKLSHLQTTLKEAGQMLAFEPPHYGSGSTVGGMVAAGISGPRRPFGGSVRDHVLGAGLINGRGEHLAFGGQVMKNVAGYDVSRLIAGSMGTLGIITDVSFKVLPLPVFEQTLRIDAVNPNEAIAKMSRWMSTAAPISALAHVKSAIYVRLSGAEKAVRASAKTLGGDSVDSSDEFWLGLREHTHDEFGVGTGALWRLSVPPATPMFDLGASAHWIIDWGGAQRWLTGFDGDADAVRDTAAKAGGHATIFRGAVERSRVFAPLTPGVLKIQRRLKAAFDPKGIFNPRRLYADF